ncbi:MAG TPA: hypothetical protein VFD49_23030 [Candidatus Dormibacteraeota bacterium]|nr:hypothetical protein [Candidatus Dormibacteraeota bacterium]
MPTRRHRHVVTETEQVARALDDAAERWPADRQRRSRLLLRLLEEGHRAILRDRERRRTEREEAIRRTNGALTGLYGPGYLRQLREDWPA